MREKEMKRSGEVPMAMGRTKESVDVKNEQKITIGLKKWTRDQSRDQPNNVDNVPE
jgi:hypothetical protein